MRALLVAALLTLGGRPFRWQTRKDARVRRSRAQWMTPSTQVFNTSETRNVVQVISTKQTQDTIFLGALTFLEKRQGVGWGGRAQGFQGWI